MAIVAHPIKKNGPIANTKNGGKPIANNKKGGRSDSLNSTFKIALKKGLDSEDADRRDSMNRLIFSSLCRADETIYKKTIFTPQMEGQKKMKLQKMLFNF